MKTKITLIFIVLLILGGCSDEQSRDEVLFTKYEAAYNQLISNDKFNDKSDFYNLGLEVYELSNGEYRVDVILDQPNVAMYNVQMIMELDSKGIEQFDEIIPSLGIVDNSEYNLIPNQVNNENNFYSGLILSALSEKDNGVINLMVTWSNYANTKQFVEYIELEYDNFDLQEEIIEAEDPEDGSVDE